MFLGFDFYRDDSISDLEDRIKRINSFLNEKVSTSSHHRHFGVFLLTPTDVKSNSTCLGRPSLTSKQLKNHYSILFQFFDDNSKSLEDCEILFDLGPDLSVYTKVYTDVLALSYLASLDLKNVQFMISQNSLSVLVKFDDNDPRILQVKKHLEFVIPGIAIPEN